MTTPTPDGVSTRPVGWSPGALVLVAAWVVGVAIARLTGAAAVILVLAASAVALALEAVAGWRAVRRSRVARVEAPGTCTVGVPTTLRVVAEHTGPATRAAIRQPGVDQPITVAALRDGVLEGSFARAGVVTGVEVDVEAPGPAGLIWWRRRHHLVLDHPVHVAPVAGGAPLPIDVVAAPIDGDSSALHGNHGGDIDGVRPWREGDSANGVHWPSSMRTGELIVHDRRATSEQAWTIDLDRLGGVDDAARLRRTLDDGLHAGHRLGVRTGPQGGAAGGTDADDAIGSRRDAVGSRRVVASADDALTWSARIAERGAHHVGSAPRVPLLRRELRRRDVERDETVDTRARWLAAAATLLAMGALLGALGSSLLVAIASCVGVIGGAVVSLRSAHQLGARPTTLRVATAAGALGALAWIAADARGVDGLLAALRGPLPDLLLLLVVLHGVEVVDRRTLRVHLAIGMVVALYAAGLRIDGDLGWWLAAWAAAFVGSLLAMSAAGRARADRPRPTARPPTRTALRRGGWVAAGAALTLGVLSIVPIPDGPARLGLPALSNDAPAVDTPGALAGPDGSPAPPVSTGEPSRGLIGDVVGYPGFTESLDTSVRGDLGDQVVMRVRAPEPAFWRGQTFADFDGRTWTISGGDGRPRPGPDIDVPPTLGDVTRTPLPTRELVQTYFVESDLPNIVFAAQRATRLVFDGQVWTRPDGALRSDVTLSAGSVYTAVSERIQVTPRMLRRQGDIADSFARVADTEFGPLVEPFLQLPESTSAATVELADSLRAPDGNTYDTILAYQDWLEANTEYDLDAPVPADGADAVDDFLFNSRRGYCEQIASTLAVMLRSQGVPARLATGYVSGERDRVSGVWVVRAHDAHSWVEVWFPETGWEPFDPTANVPLAGDADSGTVGGDLTAALISSLTSRPVELGLVAVGGLALLAAARLLGRVVARRRRGRWGVLQDRFTGLAAPAHEPAAPCADPSGPAPITNRTIAEGLADPRAAEIAAALDRAAFDPTWSDDDDTYTRARATLRDLERAR